MSHAPARGRCGFVLRLVIALCSVLPSLGVHAGITESGGTVAARPTLETPSATLDRASVPAQGPQTALLSVERFGRVAVLARSAQGVSLQLVDRVAGPSAVSGHPGESDGRVEGFLDHGEYRVIARGDAKGQGEARLEARAFKEQNAGTPPLLPHLTSISTTLGDFEQRSWWIHVTERGPVALEAAGRALGDLRLWQDGQWLVDAEPGRGALMPDDGRPLTVLRLAPQLEPGLYLLTAYGGPPLPWAREDGSSPLHVRSGIPALSPAHRQRHVMGPMGIERFSVPGDASFFRIELDEAPASLGVGIFEPAAPFAEPGVLELVTKESLPPATEIRSGSRPDRRSLVTVTAPPGKAYILQSFDASERQPIPFRGRAFITTVHSGHAADSIDATGVLYSTEPQPDGHVVRLADQAIPLSGSAAWARRFNLVERTELYFKVMEAGDYQVDISGVDADCVIEPFLVTMPEGYESPRSKGAGSTWDLDEGLHVLTLFPRSIGIADVAVRKAGLWDRLLESLGRDRAPGVPPLRPSVLIGDITITDRWDHVLALANRPGITSGLVVRAAPVDLATPLPLAIPEGERITVPVTVKEESTLRAELEDGTLLPLILDGAESADEVLMPAGGEHRLTVVAPATGGPRILSIVATPRRTSGGLIPLPAELMPKPPALPVLLENQARFFDLKTTESRTFLMKAPEGALYRVETTGLLATAGNLRTRTVTSLARATSGGTGRNFLVQQYLRSGDYHVTVSALGKSAGHLGMSLKRAAVREGGDLETDVQANATLPGGEAIAFDLNVAERSTWHLRAVALGRTLRCRLEADGGWPIEIPGGPADITRELEPGRYRLIVLPEATTARVAVLATRLADPLKREGHGPFDVPFDEVITHQWTEPAEGGERVPDRWNIVMTGTSDVTIDLGNGMEGRLLPGSSEAVIIRSGRPWTGALLGGQTHVLEVMSPRRDNRRAYTLSVRPAKLLPGMTREVSVPVEVELASILSAAPGSSMELSSSGLTDVRARLVDAEGRTLMTSDDAPDDWNFRFDDVPASAARVIVEPVGASGGSTSLTLRGHSGAMPSEALAIPLTQSVDLAEGKPRLLLLDVPRGDGLLVVSATSRHEMTIEASVKPGEGNEDWTAFDRDAGRRVSVAVPRSGAGEGRQVLLSLRASRGGRAVAQVKAVMLQPPSVDPAEGRPLALERVAGIDADVFAGTLAPRQATLLRIAADEAQSLRLVRAIGPGFEPVRRIQGDLLALESNVTAWLIATSEDPAGATSLRLDASKLFLRPGAEPERLSLGRDVIGCEVAATANGKVRLVVVESAGAQPDVVLDPNSPRSAMPGTTWPGGAAAAGGEGPISRAWMRLAEASAAQQVAPARAFVLDAGATPRDPLGASWSGAADPALTWRLPGGAHVVRLILDAGTFAILTDGWTIRSVHGSTTAAIDETFVATESSLLHVVAMKGSSGRHAVQVHAAGEGSVGLTLSGEAPVELIPTHDGRTRVSVVATQAGTLRVRGVRGATLMRGPLDTLQFDDGAELAPGRPATLVLEHGLEPVAAWLDIVGGGSAWGSARPASAPRLIAAPASVGLEGAVTTLRVEGLEPALLSLRTTHPVVARVRRAGGAPSEAEAWPHGARLDAWVPAGATEIDLRGFAAAQLGGSASVTLAPASELKEGVGDALFLPAGSSRAFAFTLPRAARVGLGARASSEDITVLLLDASGAEIGSGIVQSPRLEAGRYVLVVRAPASGAPLSIRPVLLGLDDRGTGPPPDVVRAYVLGDEDVPENAAPQPPDWRRWLGLQSRSENTSSEDIYTEEGD